MLVGVGAMAVNIGLSLILVRPLAHGGLALANSTATLLEMAFLMWLLRGRLGGWGEAQVARSLVRIVVAAAIMAAVVWALLQLLAAWSQPVQAVIIGGAAIAVYAAAAWLLTRPK